MIYPNCISIADVIIAVNRPCSHFPPFRFSAHNFTIETGGYRRQARVPLEENVKHVEYLKTCYIFGWNVKNLQYNGQLYWFKHISLDQLENRPVPYIKLLKIQIYSVN